MDPPYLSAVACMQRRHSSWLPSAATSLSLSISSILSLYLKLISSALNLALLSSSLVLPHLSSHSNKPGRHDEIRKAY